MCKIIKIEDDMLASDINCDVFAIDTNALLWTFYPKSYSEKAYANKAITYSSFITQLIESEKNLLIFTFNFSEFMFVIEKIEYQSYCKEKHKDMRYFTLKHYRRIPEERQKVKEQCQLVYKQIVNIPQITIVDTFLEQQKVQSFVNDFSEHYYDFFDYYLQKHCLKDNVSIISDDKDFNTNDNFILFTANNDLVS